MRGVGWLMVAVLGFGCEYSPRRNQDVAVRVNFVAVDERVGSPVVVLEDWKGDRSLPIWIGLNEARSIASEMEEVQPVRPNTHDLAKNLIEGLDASVERVVVTELRSAIYYAVIEIRTGGRLVEIDSRPSDAIAIALRFGAPLFAREALLEDPVEGNEDDAGQAIDFEGPNRLVPPQATRRASRPGQLENRTLIKKATCVEHASPFPLRREPNVAF